MKNPVNPKSFIEENKGFVLLYALLVASVVLVIGLTLSNIIVKQLLISSVSRELNNAYYASNAGRECLKFMQSARAQAVIFTTSDPSIPVPNGVSVSCADVAGSPDVIETSPYLDWATSVNINVFGTNNKLTFDYVDGSGPTPTSRTACAKLEVKAVGNDNFKAVWSQGYNSECDNATYTRKVERMLCSEFFYNVGDEPEECLAEL